MSFSATISSPKVSGLRSHATIARRIKQSLLIKEQPAQPLSVGAHYQILIYGALLERMGFDCSKLNLALIRLEANQLPDQEKRIWITRISHYLEEGRIDQLETKLKGLTKVHLIRHDVAAAEVAVRSKQGYWLGQRSPTSSLSLGRCRACGYHKVCEKSLYKET